MAEYDLSCLIAAYLDPIIEFLQKQQLFPDEEILKIKIHLLNNTNKVDNAMDIHKSLYDVPQEMVYKRVEVPPRLKALEVSAAPLISFLQNANDVQELRADKQYNLQMLDKQYQIGPDQIEALYQYAKFHFECGNYSAVSGYLNHYIALCTNSERSVSALWAKLAAEILMQNWDIALEVLNRLKDIIDSKNFASSLNQVQSRIWLMHWGLFIFFNHDNGRNLVIDLFNQDKYLNAIQTNAPHLLRYLAIAFIVNKRRRPQFKDFIKVIQPEQHSYEDPITDFLTCIYVKYDFDDAQKKMTKCEQVILNDPFLGKCLAKRNFSTVPLRDEFLENARLFIFEAYCQIHQRIDIGVLAEKLNLNYDEAKKWIDLIGTTKLEAKIDTESGTVVMEPNRPNVCLDHGRKMKSKEDVCLMKLVQAGRVVNWATGTFVGNNRTILTTSCHFQRYAQQYTITGRRLTEEKFYELKHVYTSDSLGLTKLELIDEEPSNKSFGELVVDGNLKAGQEIYTYLNASGRVGEYLFGYIACDCPDTYIKDSKLCKDYDFFGNEVPLNYRKMGDYWNIETLSEEDGAYDYERNRLAELVIIPITGIDFNYCEGSPLYDLSGKIVGIFIYGGSDKVVHQRIALHVSAIREFLGDLL